MYQPGWSVPISGTGWRAGAVVGKTCEAVTTLAPTGYVRLDGRRYEAFSQSGHVAKGTVLRVVAVDNFRLTVTRS